MINIDQLAAEYTAGATLRELATRYPYSHAHIATLLEAAGVPRRKTWGRRTEAMMDFDEWMEAGAYLPAPLRDFHAQKSIFQIIGEMVTRRQQRGTTSYDRCLELPNWVHAHIYVIDFFLWFMARRGYTLQRSRRPFAFVNLDDDLAAFEKRKHEAFRTMLESRDR